MDCKEFMHLLDEMKDGVLSREKIYDITQHKMECPKCAELYRMVMDCHTMGQEMQVPEEFECSWRSMIRQESEGKMKKREGNMHRWQRYLAVAAAFLFVVGGTLITRDDLAIRQPAGEKRMSSYEENAAYGANTAASGVMMMSAAPKARSAAPQSVMTDSAVLESGAAREEKIIRNASFTIKTLHFEADLDRIQQLTAEMGGRVEYVSTSGDRDNGEMRYGSLTLRIPAAQLDAFLSGAEMVGTLTSLQQDAQDVSDNYYDIQARMKTQQTKMDRLQELLSVAEDVSDLIQIESSIADTQYLLDSYMAQLQSYDSRVEYSTVRVTVREIQVLEAQEATFGERIVAGLHKSLDVAASFVRDAAIFLVAALPWLAVLAVVIGSCVLIVRKKKKEKKE